MRKRWWLAAVVLVLASAAMAQDAKLVVGQDDTIRTVLAEQVGKPVTLKLDSGEELTGTVRLVGKSVAHLEKLAGKDFFDAVVDLEEVAAVIVRVR